jgi:voltage-dependent anion channel protein 2
VSTPVLFKDFGKKANDVLSEDFVKDQTLELKTAGNGLNFTTKFVRNEKGALTGLFSTKLKHGSTNGTIKLESGNKTSVEAIIEDPIPGLKVKFNGSQAPGKDKAGNALMNISAKTTAEFKREMIAFSLAVDPAKPTLNASVAAGNKDMAVGAEGVYAAGVVKGIKAGFHFTESSGKTGGSCVYDVDKAAVCVRALHNLDSSITVAVQLDHDSKKDELTAGLNYNLDKTTFTKAKLNTAGLLTLLYSQKIRPSVTLRLGGSVDTHNLDKPNHKFGISFLVDEK